MTSYHLFSKCIYFSNNLAVVVDDELKKTLAFTLKIKRKKPARKKQFCN
jgi:hypothetical protein